MITMDPSIIPVMTHRNIITMITILFIHTTLILLRDAGRNFVKDSDRDSEESDTKKARASGYCLKSDAQANIPLKCSS
jgi:hypothetical protein